MAQAKQKSSQQAARKRGRASAAKAKSQNGSRSRSRGASTKAKTRTTQPKAQGKPAEVVDAVEEKAKGAGRSVGRAAKRARVPLLAGGAAIAGAAGGAALASRQSHRHRGFANGLAHSVRKIDSDDVARAAKRVGDATARVGRFAADFQRARESSDGAGNGRHRSPIEVVLHGLTARR